MKEYRVKLHNQPLFWIVQADNEEEAKKKGYAAMLEDMSPEYLALGCIRVEEVVDELPKGWKVDDGAVTAPNGYVWIYNGKGFFSGREDKIMHIK